MNNDAACVPKKILVTGAAGFLGCSLCERLLADGHHVVGMDNYFMGSKRNIEHLIRSSRFAMYHGDIVNSRFADEEFDQIFDFACQANPIHRNFESGHMSKDNVDDAINIVALARRTGARILQASIGQQHVVSSVHCFQGHDRHGFSMPSQQAFCRDGSPDDLPVKLRIFNAYGPHMNPMDDRVIPKFVVNALKGEPITIHGDGCQTRNFCFADDIVDGLIRMMASPEDIVGPIDLGSNEACMILDLVNMIVEATGTTSKIEFEPLASTGPKSCAPDLALAKRHLSWSPRMPVRIGLAETIGYFDQLLRVDSKRQPMDRQTPISSQSLVA